MNLTINRANSMPMEAVKMAATEVSAPKVDKTDWPTTNLCVSSVNGEAEIEIPDEVLRCDDDLGKLFDRAFPLSLGPTMPNFQE